MQNELGIQVHLSETKSEHDECIRKYGKTPTKLFLNAGIWNTRAVAAHGVHVTDEDMDIFSPVGTAEKERLLTLSLKHIKDAVKEFEKSESAAEGRVG